MSLSTCPRATPECRGCGKIPPANERVVYGGCCENCWVEFFRKRKVRGNTPLSDYGKSSGVTISATAGGKGRHYKPKTKPA